MNVHRLGVAVLVIVLAACASGSGRETELPPVPTAVTGTVAPLPATASACRFGIGPGVGTEVTLVQAGTPAASVIQVGDVIIAADGEATPTSRELITAIRAKAPGESIAIELERDGEPMTADVQLIDDSARPGRTIMGINVSTAIELADAQDLADAEPPTGRDTRVMGVDGDVYVLDPVPGEWAPLGLRAPEAPLAPSAGQLWALDSAGSRLVRLIGDGPEVPLQLGSWNATSMVGSDFDSVHLLLSGEDEGEVQAALAAVSPNDGVPAWVWEATADDEGRELRPILTVAEPAGDMALVALSPAGATEGTVSYALIDGAGVPFTPPSPVPDAIRSGAPLGWWSDGSLLYRSGDGLLIWDIAAGTTEEPAFPVIGSLPSNLRPVGDGEHVLAATESSLSLLGAGDPGLNRRLLVGCAPARLTGHGWGSSRRD